MLAGMSDRPVDLDVSSPVTQCLPINYANFPECELLECDEDGINENVSKPLCLINGESRIAG